MKAPDVLVVGGGVVGAACARWLSQQELAVRVLDSAAEAGIASRAAAGILAPLAETNADDPLLSLKVRGRDLYHEVAPALREETGIDIRLRTEGIVHVALSSTEMNRLTDQIAWQRQMGFKSDWLSQGDLREQHPEVSPKVLGAKFMPEGGALDPELLVEALLASAVGRHAEVTRGVRVTDVLIEAGAVVGVRTETETLSCGAVVLAAGAWSGRIGGLPRPLSVEPIRGQMAAVDWPNQQRPAVIYGGSGYVVRRGSEAVVGTTVEHAGFDASVTEAGIEKVLNTLRSIYPALAHAPVKRTWAGLRPGTPDGQPIVGPDPDVDGLWYATGHGRNGFLLAAITGQIVSQLFMQESVEPDITSVDPTRFWPT